MTKRPQSYPGHEAIADLVECELKIVARIKRGLDDMRSGRVVSHEEAMRRLRATIARAALKPSPFRGRPKAGTRNP